MSLRPHMILLSAGLLSLGAAAFAQASTAPAPAPAGGRFMAPSADRAALKARLEQRFDALDTNKDGTVTPEERKAQRAEMRGKMRERMFARLDTNQNGSISKDEFNAPRQRPDGAGKRDGRHHMGGAMKRHHFAAWRNEPITRTAFVDAGLSRFDRVDTDHDGKISPAERDAARKAMRDRLAPAGKPTPPPPGQ